MARIDAINTIVYWSKIYSLLECQLFLYLYTTILYYTIYTSLHILLYSIKKNIHFVKNGKSELFLDQILINDVRKKITSPVIQFIVP